MNGLKNINIFFCLCCLVSVKYSYAFRFVVYADSRAKKSDWPTTFNRPVIARVNACITQLNPRPAFALFLGDAVNRSTADYTHNYLTDWKTFMHETLDGIPFYMAIGNSDLYGATWAPEYALQQEYQTVFSDMPNNGPTNYKKLVYSFEYGRGAERSLFVVLDSFGFYRRDGHWVNFENGYDTEQINWFRQHAGAKANHKFVFTHAPAFSVQGRPRRDSARTVWQIAQDHQFDMFFCGHEHVYSRWLIPTNIYPFSTKRLFQIITGPVGAPINPPSRTRVQAWNAHIHNVYNFTVVDVDCGNIKMCVYKLMPNGSGGYTVSNLDNVYTIK